MTVEMFVDAVRAQPVVFSCLAALATLVAGLFVATWGLIGRAERLEDRADLMALFSLQLMERQDSTRKSVAKVAKEVRRLRDEKGRFVKAHKAA